MDGRKYRFALSNVSMPLLMSTETRDGEMVSSSDNCLTSSGGGAGATVHRYSFFVINAILRSMTMVHRHRVRECIFHTHAAFISKLAPDIPISRILSFPEREEAIIYLDHTLLYDSSDLPVSSLKELSGHLFFRGRKTKLTRSCSQWGFSCPE